MGTRFRIRSVKQLSVEEEGKCIQGQIVKLLGVFVKVFFIHERFLIGEIQKVTSNNHYGENDFHKQSHLNG